MYPGKIFAAVVLLLATADARDPPTYTGYKRTWSAAFKGTADTLPHKDMWNIAEGDKNDNNELQSYRWHKNNLRFSGSETLQIIPRKDSTATRGWTSGRIESLSTFTPENGKVTRIESELRVANNPAANKQGMWYAFWLNGDSFRKGTAAWPACGELDLFENINGQSQSHGVAHCDVYPGGACKEPEGLVKTTPLTDDKYHVWRIEVDRRPTDWKQQKITWFVDGKQYHQILGSTINNSGIWSSLAHKPFYVILNVAVGGNWVSTSSLCCLIFGWNGKLTIWMNSLAPRTRTPSVALAA